MKVKDLRGFIFENYFKKDLILLATNLTKKIPDPTKTEEQHELFSKKK